jgi:putative toxin-antitoxin system antitoxin component (TIGR02293 family)
MTANAAVPARPAVPGDAVRRLRDAMARTSLDATGVARILGRDPKTVGRWLRHDTVPRWDTRERLLALDVVLERLADVVEPRAAGDWLFTPVPALDYERPVDLVRSGEHRRVLALIDALGEGVFA